MEFNFSIGGYFTGEFEFRLDKKQLYLYDKFAAGMPSEPILIIQNFENDSWVKLKDFLMKSHWKPEYQSDAFDGIQWSLIFAHKEVKIKSYGSNVFPEEFNQFITSLNWVLHKYGFKYDLCDFCLYQITKN